MTQPVYIARHVSMHYAVSQQEQAAEPEPDVACRISPSVRITLLPGGCWAVQKRTKASWTSVGYHGSFYQAAEWLLKRRPDLLVFGELGHLDSLLRAYDVALAKLRVMIEPLSRENEELKQENSKLQLRLADLEERPENSPQS